MDDLIGQFPTESDLVLIRIFLQDQISISIVMSNLEKHLLPLSGLIKKRDESFFMKHDALFQSIDSKQVSKIRKLWRSPEYDEEDREMLWKWMDTIVAIVDRYVKIRDTRNG
ncbi:hypothetical protein OAF54_03115 [bacterium]|nr:hypothetical protein [bacterium]